MAVLCCQAMAARVPHIAVTRVSVAVFAGKVAPAGAMSMSVAGSQLPVVTLKRAAYTEFAVPSLCTHAATALPVAKSMDSEGAKVLFVRLSSVTSGPHELLARV